MRSFAVVAAVVGAAAAQSYGVITQISDGQIQNPATSVPVETAVTSVVVVPTGYTSVVIAPTGYSSVVVIVPTGSGGSAIIPTSSPIYSNSTVPAVTSTLATSVEATPSESAPAETTSAVPTGAASAVKVGSFGFAAALAALFLA